MIWFNQFNWFNWFDEHPACRSHPFVVFPRTTKGPLLHSGWRWRRQAKALNLRKTAIASLGTTSFPNFCPSFLLLRFVFPSVSVVFFSQTTMWNRASGEQPWTMDPNLTREINGFRVWLGIRVCVFIYCLLFLAEGWEKLRLWSPCA